MVVPGTRYGWERFRGFQAYPRRFQALACTASGSSGIRYSIRFRSGVSGIHLLDRNSRAQQVVHLLRNQHDLFLDSGNILLAGVKPVIELDSESYHSDDRRYQRAYAGNDDDGLLVVISLVFRHVAPTRTSRKHQPKPVLLCLRNNV